MISLSVSTLDDELCNQLLFKCINGRRLVTSSYFLIMEQKWSLTEAPLQLVLVRLKYIKQDMAFLKLWDTARATNAIEIKWLCRRCRRRH